MTTFKFRVDDQDGCGINGFDPENCIGGKLFNNEFRNKLHVSQTLYSKGKGKRK